MEMEHAIVRRNTTAEIRDSLKIFEKELSQCANIVLYSSKWWILSRFAIYDGKRMMLPWISV